MQLKRAGGGVAQFTRGACALRHRRARAHEPAAPAAALAWGGVGENIAAGYTSIDDVMSGWMATSANTYPTYWTMDLAKPR